MSSGSRKVLVFLIVPFLVFSLSLIVIAFLSENDITIRSYNAVINLNEKGDMHVVETWDMHYNGNYNVRFRDIGFDKYPDDYPLVSSDDNRAYFDDESVNITVIKNGTDVTNQVRMGYSFLYDRDELGEYITCDPYSLSCESLFVDFHNVGGMNGDISFTYEYTILGAMTSYLDISELNWKLFDYMEADIKNVNVTLHVPDNAHTKYDFNLFYHGRDDASITMYSATTFALSLNDLSSQGFLEFRLLAPREIFSQIPVTNIVNDSRMKKADLVAY